MSSPDEQAIVCRTTAWYLRRMALMFLMFAFFAAWFYRDYRWGYPDKKHRYGEYQRVMSQPGGQAAWAKLSAENGWPLKPPEKITHDDIEQQRNFAAGCAVIAAVILATFLINRGKTLRAEGDAFQTPSGERVPFASVFRVDRRKWRNKGLAFVYYRSASGAEKKTAVDDLKYAGADRVLARLMSRFNGELVDVEEASPAAIDSSTNPPVNTPPTAG
ncbi:MAG: hypothetical protein ACR2OZ_13000 [Verrucomicrobiales bacterium]